MNTNASNDNNRLKTLDVLTGRITDDMRNFSFHAICENNPETALARLQEIRRNLDDAEADIRNSAA